MNQREIKFRAWDKKKKRWVSFTAIEFKRGRVFLKDGFGNYIDGDFEIVEFTGLKDSKGVEIYEGDIVKNDFGNIREIIWLGFGFVQQFGKASYENVPLESNLEVIGNIYENPELLK